MADLIAPVKDGLLQETVEKEDSKKKTTPGGELGKEEFLKLLVAQMQFQDPLEPNSDTEYISQLAQFSSLEQMQNLNTTMTNSTTMSYVGQTVIVTTTDSNGNTNEVQGVVDYVLVQNNVAFVSIDEKLYKASDITTVIDSSYIADQKRPTVAETVLSFSHTDPANQHLKVNLGTEEGEASAVAVLIDGNVIDTKYLSYDEKEEILTINKDAFKEIGSGSYQVTLAFDDALGTTITDKVTLKVSGVRQEQV